MSAEENKALARRYIEEVYAKGNLDLIDELLDIDVQEHEEFGDQKPAGRSGIRELILAFRSAFPDISVEIEDPVAEGDRVFLRTNWAGTHHGDFMGIEATGKRIYFTSIDELRFSEGKIKEHWGVTDTMGLMMQLGGLGTHVEYPGGSSLYLDG